jgi:hypothetical protein
MIAEWEAAAAGRPQAKSRASKKTNSARVMAPRRNDKIYCNLELARCPRDEFFEDPEHGTVHFKNVEALHTTTGELIKVPNLPGVAIRIKDDLNTDIRDVIPGLAAVMKEKFGADSIEDLRKYV